MLKRLMSDLFRNRSDLVQGQACWLKGAGVMVEEEGYLAELQLGAQQQVVVVSGRGGVDGLQLGCREEQGGQGLERVARVQRLVDLRDGYDAWTNKREEARALEQTISILFVFIYIFCKCFHVVTISEGIFKKYCLCSSICS